MFNHTWSCDGTVWILRNVLQTGNLKDVSLRKWEYYEYTLQEDSVLAAFHFTALSFLSYFQMEKH